MGATEGACVSTGAGGSRCRGVGAGEGLAVLAHRIQPSGSAVVVCSAVLELTNVVVVALATPPRTGAGTGVGMPVPTVYGKGNSCTQSLHSMCMEAGLLSRAVAQPRTTLGSCTPLLATYQNFLGCSLGPMTHILYRDSCCRSAGRRSQNPCHAQRPPGAFPAMGVKRPVQAPAMNAISVHCVV